MNNKTLSLAITATSLFAGTAMADYTGLSYEAMANAGGMDGQLDGTWTARIYANFTSSTDQLNAVYGDASNGLSISSSDGFYQNIYGANTSAGINAAFIPAFPSLAMDSWVTIGLEDSTSNSMLDIGLTGLALQQVATSQPITVHGLRLLQMLNASRAPSFESWLANLQCMAQVLALQSVLI